MSHQTLYGSYRGRVFTDQMTKPTVSKHWRNTHKTKLNQIQYIFWEDRDVIWQIHTGKHGVHDTDSEPCHSQWLGQCVVHAEMWHNVNRKHLEIKHKTRLPRDCGRKSTELQPNSRIEICQLLLLSLSLYKYWLVPRSTLKNYAPKLCNVARRPKARG